jgi:ubiquinone/menaquinone biosynthesis C-methylase UbiE
MPSLEWNRWWQRDFREFCESNPDKAYGVQWGDPELRGLRYLIQRLFHPSYGPGRLYKVVDKYIRPYVRASSTVLEIGPGGGRWTRYLVAASKVICVDINPEFFGALRSMFPTANLEFYQPQGCDLRPVPDESVDFAFSFGTFVHIEPEGISEYLMEIHRVLRPGGIAAVQYAEKKKPLARDNPTFSYMTADKMEAMAPMPIVAHNTRILKHSNIVVFKKETDHTAHTTG